MRVSILLFGILVAFPVEVTARPSWMSGTYVYENLCTEPDGGGLAGRRVVVRRSPNGDGVTYEAASGALAAPVSAASLAIDDGTQAIAFTIDSAGGPVVFRGTAAATLLSGTLTGPGGEHPVRLRRVLRSHGDEACRPASDEPETTASTH